MGAIGGLINLPISFGNQCLDGNVSDLAHRICFRLIEGSIAIRDGGTHVATALELKRQSKWAATVKGARHLPVSWSDHCGALLRTRTQFTYGTGTHFLSELRHICGVWKLFGRRVASPGMYFSVVASPSLNPFFSRVMDGLLIAWRAVLFAGNRAQVKELFYNGDTSNSMMVLLHGFVTWIPCPVFVVQWRPCWRYRMMISVLGCTTLTRFGDATSGAKLLVIGRSFKGSRKVF